MAEFDTINLYEQMATRATNPLIKKTVLDISQRRKNPRRRIPNITFSF